MFSPWTCFVSVSCVHLRFSSFACVVYIYVCQSSNQLTFQGVSVQKVKPRRGACRAVAVHPHAQTHTDCVSASSVTGSGRWSTAARCRATWSVGSAWLECRLSEPWGLQNLTPRPSLPHTPPRNTHKCRSIHCLHIVNQTHKSETLFANFDSPQLYQSLLRHFLWRGHGWDARDGCKYTTDAHRHTHSYIQTHTYIYQLQGDCCQRVCYSHLELWEWNCHPNLIGALLPSVCV